MKSLSTKVFQKIKSFKIFRKENLRFYDDFGGNRSSLNLILEANFGDSPSICNSNSKFSVNLCKSCIEQIYFCGKSIAKRLDVMFT